MVKVMPIQMILDPCIILGKILHTNVIHKYEITTIKTGKITATVCSIYDCFALFLIGM